MRLISKVSILRGRKHGSIKIREVKRVMVFQLNAPIPTYSVFQEAVDFDVD